jgi:hypothetical protein
MRRRQHSCTREHAASVTLVLCHVAVRRSACSWASRLSARESWCWPWCRRPALAAASRCGFGGGACCCGLREDASFAGERSLGACVTAARFFSAHLLTPPGPVQHCAGADGVVGRSARSSRRRQQDQEGRRQQCQRRQQQRAPDPHRPGHRGHRGARAASGHDAARCEMPGVRCLVRAACHTLSLPWLRVPHDACG